MLIYSLVLDEIHYLKISIAYGEIIFEDSTSSKVYSVEATIITYGQLPC
jgi:hypothetical protein